MNLLLDTHVWLWWITGNAQLKALPIELLSSKENQLLVSSISVWELAMKLARRKLDQTVDLAKITEDPSISFVPFSVAHAMKLEFLPLHHRDPFDRALIAQAAQDGLALVTADATLKLYQKEVKIVFC